MFLAAREKKELMKGCMVEEGQDTIQTLKMHPCSGVRDNGQGMCLPSLEKSGFSAGLQIWVVLVKGSDTKYKNQKVCPSKHTSREKDVERHNV